MTNVITDIKYIVETDEKINVSNPKLDIIFDFLIMKSFARKTKEKIAQYTERNKAIRNGKTILKGTRITTKELLIIMSENKDEKDIYEYIFKQYPSIDNKEKILYGALYEIGKTNSIIFILRTLINK